MHGGLQCQCLGTTVWVLLGRSPGIAGAPAGVNLAVHQGKTYISPEPDQFQIRPLASQGSLHADLCLHTHKYVCPQHIHTSYQPSSPALDRTHTDSRRHFAPQLLSSIELRRQASCSRWAYAILPNICALLVSTFGHFPALVWWGQCICDRRSCLPHILIFQALICGTYFRLPHHPIARLMPNGYVGQSYDRAKRSQE